LESALPVRRGRESATARVGGGGEEASESSGEVGRRPMAESCLPVSSPPHFPASRPPPTEEPRRARRARRAPHWGARAPRVRRLRNAVDAGERQWPRGRLTVLWDESLPGAPPADDPADLDVAAQVGALSVDERRLLRLRLVEDRQLEEIAPLFGWSRRTAYRR